MQPPEIRHFLRISELYLRITEQSRSAANIEEVAPLIFSEFNIANSTVILELVDELNESLATV